MRTATPAEVKDAEQQLRRLCAELRQRLLSGESAATEDLLARHPKLANEPESALELIYTEYVVREGQGNQLPAESWQQRFPRWYERLKRLVEVHQALRSEAAEPTARPAATWSVSAGPPPGESRPEDDADDSGRYEVLEEIGRGGMGVVYKARQAGLDRTVALKMILAGEFADATERQRFIREARLAARLAHPQIVQVYDVGQAGGRPYLAMEYVPGKSLADRLAAGPLSPPVAARLLAKLARAIEHAHQQGIIHRDLKPANVLLLRPDADPADCKIADFGLAKAVCASGSAASLPPTGSAAVLGTPSYMSPEQAANRALEVGPRTDVYALGAILYESLTGGPPFRGDSPLETLQQVLTLEPVPPSRLQPKVPRDLETICLSCLAKDPARRYATAAALADDLESHLAGRPIVARRAGLLERAVKWSRRRPAVALLLTALALTVVISVATITALWRSAVTALADKEAARRDEAGAKELAEGSLADKLIALADVAWKNNDSPKAREHLAEVPVSRRTERWHALHSACTAQRFAWPVDSAACGVAFDPQAKVAAATTATGTVVAWNLASGRERFLTVHNGRPSSRAALTFTADGEQLLRAYVFSSSSKTGIADHLAWHFVDAATGKRASQQTIRGAFSTPRISSGAYTILACDQATNESCLWNASSGQQLLRLPQGFAFSDAAFTPDGRHVLIPGFDGVIRKWQIAGGRLIQHWSGGATGYSPLDVDARGDRLALAAHGNCVQVPIQVRGLEDGRILSTFETQHVRINDVAVHPSGKWVASAGAEGLVVIWDCESGRAVLTLRGHTDSVETLAFSNDGHFVLTGSRDRTVRLWDFLPPDQSQSGLR